MFILFITFNAIGSVHIGLSNTHPRYVTCAYCFTFIFLDLIFSFQNLLALYLLKKTQFSFISSKMIT